MSDCSDYPTVNDAKGFKTNADTINEVVTSNDDRTSPAIDGKTKITLKGIESEVNSAIENTIGKSYIGTWTQGVTMFTTMNEYSDFNGITYKPKSGITLPYTAQTADPTTAPDNANVEPFSDVNSSNIGSQNVVSQGSTEPRTLSERFSDVVRFEDFGASGGGVADDAAAIQLALDYARDNNKIALGSGVYGVGSTINVECHLIGGTFAPLVDLSAVINVLGNGCLESCIVDGDINETGTNSKAIRGIRLTGGQGNKITKCEVKNLTSDSFVCGLFIENSGVENFLIDGVIIENIIAPPSAEPEGSLDGSARGVWYNTSSSNPTANLSSGIINNIQINGVYPWRDSDGVVVQSFSGSGYNDVNVVISNVSTVNARKRAVKVQADGVAVSNVKAYCDGQDQAMYSVVSMYGDKGGVCNGVVGVGQINNGVDTIGDSVICNVNISSNDFYAIGGVVTCDAGSPKFSNCHGEGMSGVILVNAASGDSNPQFHNISGTSVNEAVGFRADSPYSVSLSMTGSGKIFTTALSTYALNSLTPFSGNIESIEITGNYDIRSNGHFWNGLLTDCNSVVLDGLTIGGNAGGGIQITNDIAVVRGITVDSGFANQAIKLNATSEAQVVDVSGTVRIENTTDTRVALCKEISIGGVNTNLKELNWS